MVRPGSVAPGGVLGGGPDPGPGGVGATRLGDTVLRHVPRAEGRSHPVRPLRLAPGLSGGAAAPGLRPRRPAHAVVLLWLIVEGCMDRFAHGTYLRGPQGRRLVQRQLDISSCS